MAATIRMSHSVRVNGGGGDAAAEFMRPMYGIGPAHRTSPLYVFVLSALSAKFSEGFVVDGVAQRMQLHAECFLSCVRDQVDRPLQDLTDPRTSIVGPAELRAN